MKKDIRCSGWSLVSVFLVGYDKYSIGVEKFQGGVCGGILA